MEKNKLLRCNDFAEEVRKWADKFNPPLSLEQARQVLLDDKGRLGVVLNEYGEDTNDFEFITMKDLYSWKEHEEFLYYMEE